MLDLNGSKMRHWTVPNKLERDGWQVVGPQKKNDVRGRRTCATKERTLYRKHGSKATGTFHEYYKTKRA
jgi:hypothetical protein